jgi:hypothetical protein
MSEWEEVNEESILEELERRRGRKSGILEFLESAEINKWYRVSWNRGAVTRAAKTRGYKVQTTQHQGQTFVKVLEKPQTL